MDLYTFYFDESFHDRKLLVNDKGQINALREDALENYVGVFSFIELFSYFLSSNTPRIAAILFCTDKSKNGT